ncbi:alpha-L-glutamate ligase [Streptomyces sp. NBC_00237]|uniref:ATP-grasp domain-containing protein n=1 Tax=Streptomyces sp. NBC_00237 TaxID=2975687 RepID=UPI0022591531|nr:alpha-L-glutamate ligase [Streptomyces sp. NBC_00237]MCX5206497.1 alpha-L-glutamate ligase [Streptomyces sp. NBC_00237]
MRVGLITPRPDHPLLSATAALLIDGGHQVLVHDVHDASSAGAHTEPPLSAPPADVYLLKARTPRALALARALERRGARVLNSAAATALLQDRTEMAAVARSAGLPFVRTRTFAALADVAAGPELTGPVVVKSRHSRKDDLVARVDGPAELHELAARHPHEPVVVQEFVPNDGWDEKLWAVGRRVFAAHRRSELARADLDTPPSLVDRTDLVRRVGEVFGLQVYGVDVIGADDGTPLIVDINAFPGIRGQQGAPEALAALVLNTHGSTPVTLPPCRS